MQLIKKSLSLKWKHIDIAAWSLILFAVLLRLVLFLNGWPETDGEEGTMGLIARHIAFNGERPIYFYGQNYMGVGEAYIAALFYHLFGSVVSPVFPLRLAMLLLFTLFLIVLYLLGRLLFSRSVTLLSLLILALGARDQLIPQMRAVGGASETLVCGTLVLLLATWLALSSQSASSPSRIDASQRRNSSWPRWLAYAAWGLAVGLGLWSHWLVVPFVITSFVLLIIFCRHERRTQAILLLIAGLLIGALPLIIYNLTAPFNQNSLAFFWGLFQTPDPKAPTGWLLLCKKIMGTVLYALPLGTGAGRPCPILEIYPIYGTPGPDTLRCAVMQSSWSLGYLALLIAATMLCLPPLFKIWKEYRSSALALRSLQRAAGRFPSSFFKKGMFLLLSTEQRQQIVRSTARLMLILSGWATLLFFAASTSAAQRPWSTRYLVGLMIITPALLWPIVAGLKRSLQRSNGSLRRILNTGWRIALLAFILAVFAFGTIQNFQAIPESQQYQLQQAHLVQKLLSMGITRIYSGYWVCDRLNLQSQEQLICSVVNDDLTPGTTRYSYYRDIVDAAPHPAYVFFPGNSHNREFPAPNAQERLRASSLYREIHVDDYVVFIPITTNGPESSRLSKREMNGCSD